MSIILAYIHMYMHHVCAITINFWPTTRNWFCTKTPFANKTLSQQHEHETHPQLILLYFLYAPRIFGFVIQTGDFSVLQVSFNMQRLSGYFLIQVSILPTSNPPKVVRVGRILIIEHTTKRRL